MPQTKVRQDTAKKLIDLLAKTPTSAATKSMEIAKKPVYHIRNSQILAGATAFVGLVIFAFGVENLISSLPQLSSPIMEIALGLILLSISGFTLKKSL